MSQVETLGIDEVLDTPTLTETGLDISVSVEEHDELVGTGCIGRAFVTCEARIVTP